MDNSKTKFLGFCHRQRRPHAYDTLSDTIVAGVFKEVRGLVVQFYHRIRRKPRVKIMLQKFAQGIAVVLLGLLSCTLQQQYAGYSKYNSF